MRHGFARNLPWALKHNEDDNSVILTFELQNSEATGNTGRTISRAAGTFLKWAKPVKLNWKRMASLQPHPRSTAILTLATSPALDQQTRRRNIDKVSDAKRRCLADGIQTFPDRTDRVYLEKS